MSMPPVAAARRLLARSTWENVQHVGEVLRRETVGGALLMVAATLAMILANTDLAGAYTALRDYPVGVSAIHLELPVDMWAADALLAVFFFVAGLELKRELRIGDLSDPAKAAVPIVAAVCGVALPALVYLAVNAFSPDPDTLYGWAVPTATDIAFALAVLAVIGSHLPAALRSFLLTLAVVDDLIAITIIALFYTAELDPFSLLIALVPLAAFALLARSRPGWWRWLMLPLALLTWYFIHHSGVHATVAGVLLGLVIPIHAPGQGRPGDDLAHTLEHRIHPLSAGFCVPVFAFFAAGVTISGSDSPFWTDLAALGTIAGLILGKLLGVFGGTWLVAKFTRAELDDGLAWWDVLGLALLSGVGFTVSLLVSELAFGPGTPHDDHVKVGVLLGSLLAAVLASVVLRIRNGVYRDLHEQETRDDNFDGIPDIYQTPSPAAPTSSSTMESPALAPPHRPPNAAPKEDT